MNEHAQYDLFVSYADADRAWVEGYLLDALDAAGVKYHSEEAFALGVPRITEFERAIHDSRRTLLVLSPAYLADQFGQFADLLAQTYGLETATWPVIPLILYPVELPPRLAMLTALEATGPEQQERAIVRLCEALSKPVPGAPARPPCPYPGMLPFGEQDGGRFFGRDAEVRDMVERLRLHPFLAVIGPSGSGKSSLVFAGLIPALRKSGLFGRGEWVVRTMRPGGMPMSALTNALGGDPTALAATVSALLSVRPEANNLLLVVDQFEELFTHTAPDAETPQRDVAAFQRALLDLSRQPHCYVVLTVRADFYADLMACPLWGEIQRHRLEAPPLSADGLRRAVVRPAEDVGVFVGTALVERLTADAAGEPGILPLVQEILSLLWERVERRFLSLHAYESLVLPRGAYGADVVPVGRTGLQAAIARRADAALAELDDAQQTMARRIFLRLIQFGEGRADTRRQQDVEQLRAAGDNAACFEAALAHLVKHRLLTMSGEEQGCRKVDIAHEALIAGWPTLQGWVKGRQAAEQTRRRLEAKADEWVRLGRSSGGLLDEVELREAEQWLSSPDAANLGHSQNLSALVRASHREIKRAEREKEAARQRELEQARALAKEQKRRAEDQSHSAARLRRRAAWLAAILAIAVCAAAAAGVLGNQARVRSNENKALAATAEAERDRANAQARRALALQLAAQSQQVLPMYPPRSLLLAVEAVTTTLRAGEGHLPAAEQSLRDALGQTGGRSLRGHKDDITTLAFSSDGRWLATGSDDCTAWLWDMGDLIADPVVLRGHEDAITALAFSPDGRWLAIGSDDRTARLWDMGNLAAAPVVLRGHEGYITALAFSPSGRWLATGGDDHTVRLWDMGGLVADPVILRGHEDRITALAFSLDGRWLATSSGDVIGGGDTTARLWDMGDLVANPVVLRGHKNIITALAFSPDGRWLITGGGGYTSDSDNAARLWDVGNPTADPVVLRGHEGAIYALAFSPDGRWLAIGSWDATARLWDMGDLVADLAANPIVLRGHEDDITALAFSPDGRRLATGSNDATARLWDMGDLVVNPATDPVVLRGHEHIITALAFSPDGRWLATGSGDNSARLWNVATPAAAPIVLRGHEWPILTLALSPDGRWLATGGRDAAARLWDMADPAADSIVLRGHEDDITALAFSPDGRWLATGSGDATVRLWSMTNPAADPIILRGHEDDITALAFSLDGHWLVTGSNDATARLWSMRTADLVVLACQAAGRNFTRDEWRQYLGSELYRATCPDLPTPPEE